MTPPKSKYDFLAKKGGGWKPPKISQKLNQFRFGSNFQGRLNPMNDQSWQQKFSNYLYQMRFLDKKGGGGKPPKIIQKVNKLGFGSNFQGKLFLFLNANKQI